MVAGLVLFFCFLGSAFCIPVAGNTTSPLPDIKKDEPSKIPSVPTTPQPPTAPTLAGAPETAVLPGVNKPIIQQRSDDTAGILRGFTDLLRPRILAPDTATGQLSPLGQNQPAQPVQQPAVPAQPSQPAAVQQPVPVQTVPFQAVPIQPGSMDPRMMMNIPVMGYVPRY